MKTSIYLENAEINAACDKLGDKNMIGTMFDKVDNQFDLKHDDLARAMYVAVECGTDKANVKTLLSTDEEKLLREAYAAGEIGAEYLERWMDASDIAKIVVAVG